MMAGFPGFGQAATPMDHGVKMGPDGRVLIPAALRAAAGMKAGNRLTIKVLDGRVVIATQVSAIARVAGMFAHLKAPSESVVDAFLAERRAEAAREDDWTPVDHS
jgi:bifunctional DNA-binding transcriptional regulator/antitoxin component of YhaV-PrlF toxin-antitoxin module